MAVCFAQSSSNPLDVGSEDPHNARWTRAYLEAKGGRKDSDDLVADVENYQRHVNDVLERRGSATPHNNATAFYLENPEGLIDLDAEMGDEEAEAPAADGAEEDEGGSDAGSSDGEGSHTMTSDDEEFTLEAKPQDEREEILEQMASLERAVPNLKYDYKLVDRLGTGTFSTVFKAVDLHHHSKWDNSLWATPSQSKGGKVFVALKRIYVTSAPDRIRNEITILESCRGSRHVLQIITAFRKDDQIVLVLPYQRNGDFRNYFRALPMEGIKSYFRCLMRALRDIHARGTIHRDVKPANFLFDPRTGVGTLCDFGLACGLERGGSLGVCLHTPANRSYPHGRIRRIDDESLQHIRDKQREARQYSEMRSDKVGYLEKDPRPYPRANRAGTRGFRAPEVLLKCGDQTGAIDVWSAGIILIAFLSGKFPLFTSNDDTEALMEIACVIGKRRMEKVATLHSRTFASNIPTLSSDGISWTSFIEKLNPDLRKPREPDSRFYPFSCSSSNTSTHPPQSSPLSNTSRTAPSNVDDRSSSPNESNADTWARDVSNALDLVEKLMHPESIRRVTPRDALHHPFLSEEGVNDDDAFPHPYGEGVCSDWHYVDETNEDLYVRVKLQEGEAPLEGDQEDDQYPGTLLRRVFPGQGIAVGSKPCELHRYEPFINREPEDH